MALYTKPISFGIVLGLTAACAANAANNDAMSRRTDCSASEFREFDFWIGKWAISQQIVQPDGSWVEFPAETQVASSSDGCVLTEHWRGEVKFFWEAMQQPENIWGFSVRRFDPISRTWSIYWMDQRNNRFDSPHVGRFDGKTGTFFRDVAVAGKQGRTRITFTQLDADRVDWELSIANGVDARWSPLWRMKMRRKQQSGRLNVAQGCHNHK